MHHGRYDGKSCLQDLEEDVVVSYLSWEFHLRYNFSFHNEWFFCRLPKILVISVLSSYNEFAYTITSFRQVNLI